MSPATATPDRPGPPAADDEVAAFNEAIDQFARAWRNARARLRSDEGLSIAQFHLLEPLIGAQGPRSVGELAHHAGVAAPTATRMLDALVRDGVVQRTRDEGDRRCVKVGLTAAGRAAAEDRLARMGERRRRIFASLPPDDRRDAARLLLRLADAIEELQPQ